MHNRNLKQRSSLQFRFYNQLSILKVLLLTGLLFSCSKKKENPGSASLIIVNAVPGSKPLTTNFKAEGAIDYKPNTQYLNYYTTQNYPDNYQFMTGSGMQRVRLFQFPDTTEKDLPLFDLQLDLPAYSLSSLFLTGTPAAPEYVFSRDVIPEIKEGDSTTCIRFINLSPGSQPVSINLKNAANGSEISSLEFKSMSGFKRYPVTKNITRYVFEFRDAVTGTLLASFDTNFLFNDTAPNQWLYRSKTVAFLGIPGSSGTYAQNTASFQHF